MRVKPGKDSVPLAGGLFNRCPHRCWHHRHHHPQSQHCRHHCHRCRHHDRNDAQGGLSGGVETTIGIFEATLGSRTHCSPYLSCLMMVLMLVIVEMLVMMMMGPIYAAHLKLPKVRYNQLLWLKPVKDLLMKQFVFLVDVNALLYESILCQKLSVNSAELSCENYCCNLSTCDLISARNYK